MLFNFFSSILKIVSILNGRNKRQQSRTLRPNKKSKTKKTNLTSFDLAHHSNGRKTSELFQSIVIYSFSFDFFKILLSTWSIRVLGKSQIYIRGFFFRHFVTQRLNGAIQFFLDNYWRILWPALFVCNTQAEIASRYFLLSSTQLTNWLNALD